MKKEGNFEQGREKEFELEVVEHNLGLMRADMLRLLVTESIGGNAGTEEIEGKEYSCAAAAAFANLEIGEIATFGNWQDIEPQTRAGNAEIIFRVAVDFDHPKLFFRIVELLEGNLSEGARANVERAIEVWNAEREETEES